jgi:hypothetical protein
LIWLWASREKLNKRAVEMKLPWNRKTEKLSIADILQIMREKQVKELIRSTQERKSSRIKLPQMLRLLVNAAA